MIDVVFDVDGTLANIEHRRHYVQSKPKNWPAFNRAMINDLPNKDVIWVARCLWLAGARILIASGRSEDERKVTETWFANQGIYTRMMPRDTNTQFEYEKLYMRASKDYRDDGTVKKEILDAMRNEGFNPTIAFDDRDRVVAMWRANGVRCLQVAPGNF